MNHNSAYDYGYGTKWKTCHVDHKKGYSTSVTDFHEHDFYEINLILSGNVKILLKDRYEETTQQRIVLTSPGVPHYIQCQPDMLYRRAYLVFTDAFISGFLPEWKQLSHVFGSSGRIIAVTEASAAALLQLIEQIEKEENTLGQRLLIYYLLLQLSHMTGTESYSSQETPAYIFDALAYLEHHYAEKINFSSLAQQLFIGRTTLMTEFKTYTGSTLGEYLRCCRLKHAIEYLRQKKTLEYTAEKCGFSDSSGLIRAFRHIYHVTPRQYIVRISK